MLPHSSSTPSGLLLVAAWLIAVGAGFTVLNDHAATPGPLGAPVTSWPERVGLEREQSELLLFAHALCPCTDATLAELERLLADVEQPPRTRAVLWTDPAQAELFSGGRLRERAALIPGVELVEDAGGVLADAFGVATSGQLMYFDEQGERVFVGGITPGRGHEGGNAGLDALRAALRREPVFDDTAPVYGCSLGTRAVAMGGAER